MPHYIVSTKYRFLSEIDDHICDVLVEYRDFESVITLKVSATYWAIVGRTLHDANIPVVTESNYYRKMMLPFKDQTEVDRLLRVLDSIK